MERRGTLTIIAFILLAVASGWLLRTLNSGKRDVSPTFTGLPDYFFNDAIITRYDKKGLPQFELRANSAMHYPADDRTELVKVEVIYYRERAAPWQLLAQSGLIPANKEIVRMMGGVTITELTESDTPLTLDTEYLQINTKTNLLTTDADVRITQGKSLVTGQGLEADLDNEWFILNSRV